MPGPRIDREEDTRQRLLEAMSLPDLDERARAGMNQEQSDQFIGFDKLLSNVPVQSQVPRRPIPRPPPPNARGYVKQLQDEMSTSQARDAANNPERQLENFIRSITSTVPKGTFGTPGGMLVAPGAFGKYGKTILDLAGPDEQVAGVNLSDLTPEEEAMLVDAEKRGVFQEWGAPELFPNGVPRRR
jgi:hypothetical protein